MGANLITRTCTKGSIDARISRRKWNGWKCNEWIAYDGRRLAWILPSKRSQQLDTFHSKVACCFIRKKKRVRFRDLAWKVDARRCKEIDEAIKTRNQGKWKIARNSRAWIQWETNAKIW